MYEIPSNLCLEWKNLNYHVPSTEQSNYTFWNECRKVKELRILKDGEFKIKKVLKNVVIYSMENIT